MERTFNLHEITADRRARQYFVRQLGAGGRLSQRVLARVDFAQGSMFIALPETVEPSELLDFESCNFRHAPGAGEETLAQVVESYITHPDHAVLVQDIFSEVGDITSLNPAHASWRRTYKGEVYWEINSTDVSHHRILGLLRCGSHYPYSTFLCACYRFCYKSILDEDDIEEALNTLAGVVVGALDEESFLLWWDPRFPRPFTPVGGG